MLKSLIFVFLISFLLLTPITAEEEFLDIDVVVQDFYEVNVSGMLGKPIGIVGVYYPVNVSVGSPNKEVDLTNRSLEIRFVYKDIIQKSELLNKTTCTTVEPIFMYKQSPISFFEFTETINLSEKLGAKLGKGEYNYFHFYMSFLETGMYVMEWREVSGKEKSIYSMKFLSIIEPIEYENLLKQSQLLDAEKKSAEASEKTANYSLGLAIATAVLAFVTSGLVLFSYNTLKHMQKDREVDLLRRRFGNLYSMLEFNKSLLNKDLPVHSYDTDYKSWIDFYKKFRENLYLASDDLVKKAEYFLREYIDKNEIHIGKLYGEFEKDKKELISQIDEDYKKYLEKLMDLTKKPKRWWYIFLTSQKRQS